MSSFTLDQPEHIGCQTIYDPLIDKYRPIQSSDFVGGSLGGVDKDAFGRLRTSNPMTLFDSSHRYKDNGLWNTFNSGTSTGIFNSGQGLMDLTLGSGIDDELIRETTKVCSYQPGKSLLIMSTFVMNPAKSGLRQRVGYYGASNGIYLELDGTNLSFVERSLVTGSMTETRISRYGGVYGDSDTGWNIDKMDSSYTNPSGITLNISKAQIFWMDIEWLGLGSVRCGFVIDGKFIIAHTFHHANIITSTYITTASLPLRYEIKNTAATSSASTLKQICSTVISEGGYELRGLQQAVTIPVNAPRDCTDANTYYPVVSLKLKPGSLDAIVILTALSMLGVGNNSVFNWQMVASGTTSGGSWVDAGTSSAVQYNISGTSFSGGRVLASGYLTSSAQGQVSVDILKEALFKFQLERNGLTSTANELSLIVASKVAGDDVYATIDWEEISR